MPTKTGRRSAREKRRGLKECVELRATVARLDRCGFTQYQIRDRLEAEGVKAVSQARISQILTEMRDEYKRTAQRDTLASIEEKLRQWQDLRAEAWAAWERSKLNGEETTEEKALRQRYKQINGKPVPQGERMKIVKEVHKEMGRLPRNEYLATIETCLVNEAKLMNLIDDRPVNLNVMNLPWDQLYAAPANVIDPLDAAIAELPPAIEANGTVPVEKEESNHSNGTPMNGET